MKFFNDFIAVTKTKNRLPHWQQDGATFFVTWRLADSIPRELLDTWFSEKERWIAQNPKPWDDDVESEYHRRFTMKIERLMDIGSGACALRDPACREVLRKVIGRFDGQRFHMHSMVVMPNHFHILFTLAEGQRLEDVIQGWKRVSAIGINNVIGSAGTLWQKDYFDTMIRDWKHMTRVARYIRNNPAKANLQESDYLLIESDFVKSLLG